MKDVKVRLICFLSLALVVSVGYCQDATPAVQKPSINAGINDNFLDPNLDIDEWIARFEVESREVYVAREEIMRHLKLEPGDRVADVGAGTGLFTLLMSNAIGDKG